MDVAAWLEGLGLARYAQAFAENGVDAEVLPNLTAEDLKDLGVAAVGHRRRLLDAIAAMRAGAESELAGERRHVTVLFADLAGYTTLSRELDAEDVHALLGRFFERVDRIVVEHGGRVDKHVGDCVMAVFGAPLAHGNEAERAVRAALAVRAAMPAVSAEAGHDLDVHVGVAGGQVVASGTGSTGHREYTVTGDSVNLASRLTDAARAGEILVSDAVRRALGERFAGDELEPLPVKGFAEPVRAWQLRGLRMPSGRAPLVGRIAELDRFRQVLAECRATGLGRAVHIRGEPGIGKTRLLEEFAEEARGAGFACHAGLILDFGAGTGRDAVGALVRGMLGLPSSGEAAEAAGAAAVELVHDLLDADDAVFINDLLDLPQPTGLRALYDAMDPATRDAGKRQAVARLVQRASDDRPHLLLVEDLHWADPPTLAHLAALVCTVRRCPAVLVMTSRIEAEPLDQEAWRKESADDDTPLTIELGPLGDADARTLAGPFLEANAALAERCVERAAGNPLFLEQLLRNAEENEVAGVPGSVQSLVQARLDRLDPADKAALQAASALGQRFDLDTLRHLLGRPSYNAHRLSERHLIRADGHDFLFAHALVRDAVYDSLLRDRRRELHRRAADWFAERDAVLRAGHLDRAGETGAAAEAYLAAARAQAAEYRHELALRLVERGLQLAGAGNCFALASLQGEVLHDLGRMPAAIQAHEWALADASDDAERCRAWIGLAAVKRVIDDLDGATADLDRAKAAAVARGLLAEEARIHFLRGNLCFPRSDIDGCLREHRRSLELARRAGVPELEAAALGGLGDAEYVRGRMISAHEAFRRCVELCRQNGMGRIEVANRPMLAFTHWFVGDAQGALAEALAAIAAAERVGHRRARMIAHHAAYFCCRSLLDLPGALDHTEQADALARELGARRFEAETTAFRAELHRLAGRRSEACAAAEQAMVVCRETGVTFLGPFVLGVLALATDDAGAREAALAEGEMLLAAGAVSHNHFLFRRDSIDACLRSGAWDEAQRHAVALEAYASSEPLPWTAFAAARGRALAAYGRGGPEPALAAELARLKDEAERLGQHDALAAIDAALTARPVSADDKQGDKVPF